MNIADKATIQKEAEHIQDFLEPDYVPDDIDNIEDRGNHLIVYMARSGKLLADAKWHKDKALRDSTIRLMNEKLSPSTMNKLIDADCEEENYLVNWMERINRSCTHSLDWCRTQISKAKEEMRLTNYSG